MAGMFGNMYSGLANIFSIRAPSQGGFVASNRTNATNTTAAVRTVEDKTRQVVPAAETGTQSRQSSPSKGSAESSDSIAPTLPSISAKSSPSKGSAESSEASDIANSMADTSGNMYAKLMNVLGVYVASAR
jgi:hypothetical protein